MRNSISEPAPAKVNLYLHVLGRRDDGYHELQSLVAFARDGDRVSAAPADRWSLSVDGPFASPLAADGADGNLVLRAARRLLEEDGAEGDAAAKGGKAAFTLTKNLPVAAGIGGGSADAAAALRCLHKLSGRSPGPPEDWAGLGADIPVCLLNRPALVSGMGEQLAAAPHVPALPAVLVNPGVPSGTGAVFNALAGRFGQPAASPLPAQADCRTPAAFCAWLAGTRNDLTAAAVATVPPVADVLNALSAAPGSLMARMSGSGATCFGLFPTEHAAIQAAGWLASRCGDWWVCPTVLEGSPERAA